MSHDRILYVEIQQLYERASVFPGEPSDDIAVHNSPVLSGSQARLRTTTRDKDKTNGREPWNACLICLYNPLHISAREIAACSRRISRLSRQYFFCGIGRAVWRNLMLSQERRREAYLRLHIAYKRMTC